MKNNLDNAKKNVEYLDRLRFNRAISSSSKEFQQVLQLITLLLHINHPSLDGYVENVPCGIDKFQLSIYQQKYLQNNLPVDVYSEILHKLNSKQKKPTILGVYIMGSVASISQTPSSDLDIWICHPNNLSIAKKKLLSQKMMLLQKWANNLGVDITLYLMTQQHFKNFRNTEPLTINNSGSAQHMLLLDEFYRSAIRIAGKPLLWLHLDVENEQEYEQSVQQLVDNKVINLNDWVDFGGLGAFSANEYFGASLWQLYKGIDAPYKSVLKILLLETYSSEYPRTHLIAKEFKQKLLHNKFDFHFDPYLTMLDRVSQYLTSLNEKKRLDFIRRCFYMKANEFVENTEIELKLNWRFNYLKKLTKEWEWSEKTIANLNQHKHWKIKKAKESHNNLIQYLMFSYRNLMYFARKHKLDANIVPQDISILTRKLYTSFEDLPGKVTLLNQALASDLSEEHLTFIEVQNHKSCKAGWYLINQQPNIQGFHQRRYTEYSENLNKLVNWAYFNGLLTSRTNLHISSQTVSLEKLRHFVADLRLSFPLRRISTSNEELNQQCEIKNLSVIVNLTKDPTQYLQQPKSNIFASDLFSFGPTEESLVGSIDLTYRNVWNEIRTLHFEGENAILLALKVLSNKIYRGSKRLETVNVFCYSQYYQNTLRNIVSALVNKCINIQIGTVDIPKNNLLRVAGKNWQFFFEDRGISLQEIHTVPNKKNELDETLHTLIEEKESQMIQNKRNYPYEIDAFASEGFLQFFFEDNEKGKFNVYILDENNHIEVYYNCEGKKEQKIAEINHIYHSASLDENNNPYKIVQHNFNYPQFYQLLSNNGEKRIVPFHSKLVSS
ncbi:adenylate cyclase [Bisgaardia hudsonensis]|uniref:class I adenylate cyclase n=1 Tax=Bisgaardia hudsonensis TaxID=109472 RepID=UPI001049A637|nr:class I adenylate cyclase [Bisgaardia hudsonensis]QLB12191.1 adenylate cyclase [Bisgaardia hudsonensis]